MSVRRLEHFGHTSQHQYRQSMTGADNKSLFPRCSSRKPTWTLDKKFVTNVG